MEKNVTNHDVGTVGDVDYFNHHCQTIKNNMRNNFNKITNGLSYIRQRRHYGLSFCFICIMTFVGNNLLVSYRQQKQKEEQGLIRKQILSSGHNEAFLLSNLTHDSTSSLLKVNVNNNNNTQDLMISNNGLDISILSTTKLETGDVDNNTLTGNNTSNRGNINNYLIQPSDYIYTKNGEWANSPIVIEEYKLIFFTTPKVGCTVWKTLFRRMMKYNDWKLVQVHNPKENGLKYLYDYNISDASYMIQSSNWIKAIFVRDPKERFISAYLDKAVSHPRFLYNHCCIRDTTNMISKDNNNGTITIQQQTPSDPKCVNRNDIKLSKSNVTQFFHHIVSQCDDPHWKKQSLRMEEKYWQYINFVGNMETITDDSERLLRLIDAWDEYGSNGWGNDDSSKNAGRIFAPKQSIGRNHQTNASGKLQEYIKSVHFEADLETFYKNDYINPKLNLTLKRIYTDIEHERYHLTKDKNMT